MRPSIFTCRPTLAQALFAGLLLASPLFLSGCWLFAAEERVNGKEVVAQYLGLDDKSVAIVVYVEQATVNEFPHAREEISAHIASQISQNLPKTRLLDPKDVIRWQDDTINWFGLSEKDIGKHFGTDRVLMIELLAYSAHMKDGYNDLQGNIRATAKVYEVDSPEAIPAWTGSFDTRWPKDGPLDSERTNEVVVRKHTLELFAENVVRCFHTHREIDKPIRNRE